MGKAVTPTFSGEVQLAGWSESHSGGCKVTFWLSDPSDLDCFRAMTVRKGGTAGQRLACVLVEIGDDELPVEPTAPPPPSRPPGGPLAQLAGRMCNDEAFIKWVAKHFAQQFNVNELYLMSSTSDRIRRAKEMAADVVRSVCGIASRAELDHDERAAALFHTNFRLPYLKHHS